VNGSLNIEYEYDEIGNLKLSEENGVEDTIKWTVYGKVAQVIRKKGMDFMTINYRYDGAGNRVMKLIEKRIKHEITFTTTHYIRDATGNIMATYTNRKVKEIHLYGSSRLGTYKIPYEPDPTDSKKQVQVDDFHKLILGRRYYELSNHLGNVLAVISDKKILNGSTFEADVVSANDYYPFGMTIASRTFQSETYRFGFNGKENDKDFGEGIQDYGARIYDERNARFLSTDPLFKSYPWYTPYQFAGNMPIWAIDLDGLEELIVTAQEVQEFKGTKLKNTKKINIDPNFEYYYYEYEHDFILYEVRFFIKQDDGKLTELFLDDKVFMAEAKLQQEGTRYNIYDKLVDKSPNAFQNTTYSLEWSNYKVISLKPEGKKLSKSVYIHPSYGTEGLSGCKLLCYERNGSISEYNQSFKPKNRGTAEGREEVFRDLEDAYKENKIKSMELWVNPEYMPRDRTQMKPMKRLGPIPMPSSPEPPKEIKKRD